LITTLNISWLSAIFIAPSNVPLANCKFGQWKKPQAIMIPRFLIR